MEDDCLYTSFLSGDNSAYDRLMIKYGNALTLYLKGYLYSIEDAEDLMIEAFARILVGKPKICEGNFKAYLFRTAHNLVSHFYKKDRRRKIFSLDEITDTYGDLAGFLSSYAYHKTDEADISGKYAVSPDTAVSGSRTENEESLYETFWKDEKKRILLNCLGRIDDTLREALWLFYFEDMSYEQAASVMGVSRKKIDNLLTRGRSILKEELEKEGITDAY